MKRLEVNKGSSCKHLLGGASVFLQGKMVCCQLCKWGQSIPCAEVNLLYCNWGTIEIFFILPSWKGESWRAQNQVGIVPRTIPSYSRQSPAFWFPIPRLVHKIKSNAGVFSVRFQWTSRRPFPSLLLGCTVGCAQSHQLEQLDNPAPRLEGLIYPKRRIKFSKMDAVTWEGRIV